MELLYQGNVVSTSQINWSAVGDTFPFRVRQKPGPSNSLGQIKFLFPNKHDVYLHDTPSKGLFSRSSRAFSHGCARRATRPPVGVFREKATDRRALGWPQLELPCWHWTAQVRQ